MCGVSVCDVRVRVVNVRGVNVRGESVSCVDVRGVISTVKHCSPLPSS